MAQKITYLYGDSGTSDVIVTLLLTPGIPPPALTKEARGETNKNRHSLIARGTKHHPNTIPDHHDEDQEVDQRSVDLHLHSHRLRTCSTYFETCLSERWNTSKYGAHDPLHLSLEAHTDVVVYIGCFNSMYSSPRARISNVKYCLKLLQVASQIEYKELADRCVRYLAGIPWSTHDETTIRGFATSPYYPTDCAHDLTARLGLQLSDTERYDSLFKLTTDALSQYVTEAILSLCDENSSQRVEISRSRFSAVFHKVMMSAEHHPELGHELLKVVNAHVGSNIDRAVQVWAAGGEGVLLNHVLEGVHWILDFLLGRGFAGELVEFLVELSPASERAGRDRCLDTRTPSQRLHDLVLVHELTAPKVQHKWQRVIFSVLKEVIKGNLVLKASTRLTIFQDWYGMLKHGCRTAGRWKEEYKRIVGKFVPTFPFDQQSSMIASWETRRRVEPALAWPLHESWVGGLQASLISLEARQSSSRPRSSCVPPSASESPARKKAKKS